MRHQTIKQFVVLGIVCAIVLVFSSSASASPIGAGFDYFSSNDDFGNSLGSAVDLSGFGLGSIDLKGVPFLENIDGDLVIDTIIERKQGINPFDPPGGVDVVDIELVALHLVSIAPVDLTPLGGPFVGVFADLHTTVNKGGIVPGLAQPDALNPSIGQMEIRHDTGPLPTDDIGGHFDSVFGEPGDPVPLSVQGLLVPGGGVVADAIFTVLGGDPANALDVLLSTPANRLVIWSEDSEWEHLFGLGIDFQVTAIDDQCVFPECHPVDPEIIPEPTTIALLAFGGLMLARRRRQTW